MKRATVSDLGRPVGDFLEPVQTTLISGQRVDEALASLRGRSIGHAVTYFYVLDADHRLEGVVPTRRLLLASPSDRVDDLMQTPVIAIEAHETLDRALDAFAMHRYLALPVVDADRRLLGTVGVQLYADEAFEMGEEQRHADVFALVGVWVDQLRQASPSSAFKLRMPWLLCNVAGGVACAAIATYYGAVVEAVLVIAAFIPLVLTLCEGIAIQSLTLSLQGIHGSSPGWRRLIAVSGREARVSAMIGLACAAIVASVSLFWGFGWGTPLVMLVSITGAMVAAALVGTNVPPLLHLLRLDPKIAAGPISLMLADTLGLTLYLAAATIVLRP